jgi:two-component system, NarL family, sensor kinase
LAEWQLKYEDERQKMQIKTLENDKLQIEANRQKWIRNLLIISLLIGCSLMFYFFKNNQQLKAKNREIEEALQKGQTIERKRVAQELHDNLSAKISGIRWRLEAIDPDFKIEKQRKIYESSVNALAEVYTDVRLIAHNLLPAELETKGLVFALESLVKELNGLNKTEFSLNIASTIGRFQNKIEYEIFSIILELSNNILKHSKAKNALISLEMEKNTLKLLVSDNGIGIEEDSIKKGMGMSNLKSRVASLNGKMTIENREGVCVVIEVPVY